MYHKMKEAYEALLVEAKLAEERYKKLEEERLALQKEYISRSFPGIRVFRKKVDAPYWVYRGDAALKYKVVDVSFAVYSRAARHLEDALAYLEYWASRAEAIAFVLNEAKGLLGARYKPEVKYLEKDL